MKQKNYNEKLEKEKEKLNRLVDEAIKNGTPLSQDKAVVAQNHRVDVLVARIQREKERHRKSRQER